MIAAKGRFAILVCAVAAALVGCVSAGSTPAPTIGPCRDCAISASPTPEGSCGCLSSASAGASDSSAGFYLRAWQTQALAPQYTFGQLPEATVSDGEYIDGLVAIPTIYPGPIYTPLSTQTISDTGIAAIVAEIRADGLLAGNGDFSSGLMPGAVAAHLHLVIDGASYDLIGPLPSGANETGAAPGGADAFEAFWNRITDLSRWLGPDLVPSVPYTPTSLAVMLMPPDTVSGPAVPADVAWPLPGTFASFGAAGLADYRCAVVSGTELDALLPVMQNANQLTRFVDSTGAKMSLTARALLPGEPGDLC